MNTHEGPSFVIPHDVPERSTDPRPAFWLLHLFIRPKTFFRSFPVLVTAFSTAYCALIVGVSSAASRISTKLIQQDLSGHSRVPDLILESWTAYWAFCLICGIIAALLYYRIGGWWYRVRLEWSGAADADPQLARQVYIFATLVNALPVLLVSLSNAFRYPTPVAAEHGDAGWLDLSPFVFVFWSVYVSYRGVRTLFHVGPWLARIWFLVLPSLVYVVSIGMAVGAYAAASEGLFSVPPDLTHPQRINRPAFSMSYPGNWSIDTDDEDYDPDSFFTIKPIQDAFVFISIEDELQDPAELTAESLERYRSAFKGDEPVPSEKWGTHRGVGASFRGSYGGRQYRIRVFSMSTKTHSFHVTEGARLSMESAVESGFALIRRTFRFKQSD